MYRGHEEFLRAYVKTLNPSISEMILRPLKTIKRQFSGAKRASDGKNGSIFSRKAQRERFLYTPTPESMAAGSSTLGDEDSKMKGGRRGSSIVATHPGGLSHGGLGDWCSLGHGA